MTRKISVHVQADHIAALFRATPAAAVEELVWNALDAGATDVRVDLLTNALGAVEAVRISDNGSGIDILRAESTFGSLGGSWKRLSGQSASSRRLHGRRGCGRFKAFALGERVEWRTTVSVGGELMSYVLAGEASEPGVFSVESAGQAGPGAGTEVFVTGVRSTCDSLLDAIETVQALASRFSLYLKAYPDVRIHFNGLPVTPVVVQRASTRYRLTLENGATAALEIVEWKRAFAGAGRLVFSGPDGFRLHEIPAGVRAGGASYTAYLVSPRFPALSAENALVMDELNPEVRAYVDAAKKALKAHFSNVAARPGAPFRNEWSARLAGLTPAERGEVLKIVRRLVKADKEQNANIPLREGM
jgi:hypothetical protein